MKLQTEGAVSNKDIGEMTMILVDIDNARDRRFAQLYISAQDAQIRRIMYNCALMSNERTGDYERGRRPSEFSLNMRIFSS